MTSIVNISCVIIAKNAAATLEETLKSLQAFQDVVLYSNNSTDNTNAIAQSFNNVNLIEGDFLGFGPTKNIAASFAKNEWILSIDADEVLSYELVRELQSLTLQNKCLYSLLRQNYYKQSLIKHCWGNDIIIRLYNKTETSFTDKHLHEHIICEGFSTEPVGGVLRHYPYTSITDFIIKLERYSTIYAQDNVGKKSSSPAKAFFNGVFSFLKTYILKRGFLDGYAGLIIAFSHMATNFYKYMKLYELNCELKKSQKSQ